MANMSVKMSMTLDDMASPGLKAFMDLLEAAGPKVTGFSNRLNTLERSLNRVGTASESSATKLNTFDAATVKAESNAAKLGATLAGITGMIAGFDAAVIALRGAVNSLATTFNTLNTAANGMAGGMHSAAGGIGAANAALATMQGRVHGLTDSLRGMAEIWASIKLFEAGKATIGASSEFQQLEARVKSMNLPAGQNEEFIAKSRQMSKDMPYISINQAMEARLAAVGGLGRNTSEIGDPQINNIIDKVLPAAINAAMVLKMRGDQSEIKDIVRNLFGVVEMRGQTSNPDQMIKSFDLVVQSLGSTQGKLTTKDLETVMRYLKNATGQMMNDEGIANVVAFANQLRASGTGGGGGGGAGGVSQAGTAVTQVVKWALGGSMNKEAIRMFEAMGEINPKGVRADSSTTMENVSAGAFKHSKEMLENPIGAMTQILGPMFLAFTKANKAMFFQGEDINDPAAQDRAVARLIVKLGGTVNVGNVLAQSVLPGPSSRIEAEKNLTFQSKGVAESMKDLLPTFALNVEKFKESLNTIEVALGTTLLPALTKFLDVAAQFLRWLDEVAQSNPTTVQITLIAGAIAMVSLALSGLQRMFGIFTSLKAFAVGLGADIEIAAAMTATGIASTVAKFVGVLNFLMRSIIPLASALLLGWDIGTIISGLEHDGASVHEWAVINMGRLVTTFENGWLRIKNFFHLISDAQMQAQIDANNFTLLSVAGAKNLAIARGEDQSRPGAVSGKIGGLPVNPATGYSETPEERRRRINKERSDFLLAEQDLNYKPPNKDANKLFFNPAADAEKQQRRIDAAQEVNDLRTLDKEYANSKIGVDAYFDTKISKLKESAAAETKDMQQQVDALKSPARGKVDEAAVSRVSADIKIRDIKLQGDLAVAEENREKAHIEFQNKRVDVDREVDTISGRRNQAEIERQQKLLDAKRIYFAVQPGQEAADTVAKIDIAKARVPAVVETDEAYKQLQAQLSVYKDKEKEVTDAVQAGTKTQYEAEMEVYNLRKDAGALMDAFVQKYGNASEATGDVKWIKNLADLSQQSKAALTTLSPEVLKIKGILESGFTGFFEQIMQGGHTVRSMFQGLFSGILKGFQNLVAQVMSQNLMKALFGIEMGSGTVGSTMSGMSLTGGGGMLGALFGSSGPEQLSGPGMTSSGGFWSSISDWFSGLSFDVGTGRVPSDMIAQIHKDEIIVNPSDAAGVRSGQLILSNGAASSGVSIGSLHMQVDAGTGESSLSGDTGRGLALGQALTKVVQLELIKQKLPGGILS